MDINVDKPNLCREEQIPVNDDLLLNHITIFQLMSKPAFQSLANLGGSNLCFMNSIIQEGYSSLML